MHALRTFLKRCPHLLLSSPSLPVVFDLALVTLTLPGSDVVMNTLETLVDLLEAGTKDAGSPYLATMQSAAKSYGHKIVTIAVNGMVQNYPEESQDAVIDLLKQLTQLCPAETREWVLTTVQSLPGHIAPATDKQEFCNNLER